MAIANKNKKNNIKFSNEKKIIIKEILDLEPLTAKLKSFNFNTININGHSVKEIDCILKINQCNNLSHCKRERNKTCRK